LICEHFVEQVDQPLTLLGTNATVAEVNVLLFPDIAGLQDAEVVAFPVIVWAGR
jgi:hypothetical protein